MNKSDEKMMVTVEDLIVEFASNYSLGMKAVKAAAETYATALRKFPKTAEAKFRERFREIRNDTWRLFEEIGNGKLPPQVILMNPGAVEKLRNAKLPAEKSAKVAMMRVSVVNPATGKPNDVPFTYLTESQADQVFNPVTHRIRTLDEQKRYLKRIETGEKRQSIKPSDWEVKDGKLIVRRACSFTRKDIESILALM